jgi:BirA family biotin operon repressor/biotin-[acetyl-CoA-carboxylase] ligase
MSEVTFDLAETTGRVCKNASFGWDFVGLETVESTNAYAKEHYVEYQGPTLIVAKTQTAGYGRKGSKWDDEGAGKSFLSTWTTELLYGPPDPRWTLGIGLYLFESLSEAFPSVRFSLKAPNDICIGDKKLGGLLVEASSQGEEHQLHVGLGLNVFSYPATHSDTATHLNAYLGGSQLTVETWTNFIEYFGKSLLHLEKRVKNSTQGWLPQISNRLVMALNRHPKHAENPVKSVQVDGTLICERGQVSWTDL